MALLEHMLGVVHFVSHDVAMAVIVPVTLGLVALGMSRVHKHTLSA